MQNQNQQKEQKQGRDAGLSRFGDILPVPLAFFRGVCYTVPNSRGDVMQPLMLIVHAAQERALRLSFAAMAMGVRARIVADSECTQTVGMLCGLDAAAPTSFAGEVSEEMLVFAFLTEERLEQLLAALRQSGLPPVRLKAVLTPSNRHWPLGFLQAELCREAKEIFRTQEDKP